MFKRIINWINELRFGPAPPPRVEVEAPHVDADDPCMRCGSVRWVDNICRRCGHVRV